MIEVRHLTKSFGAHRAVDDLTFRVEPGAVTGFLGPNGAGKSTTMRMILGLDHPTSGHATVGGRPLHRFPRPLRVVGALLDAHAVHGGRTARNHLLTLAQSNRIPPSRVDDVLEQVGMSQVAGARVKGFSLGMRQRLGLAGALLGDPEVLLLDEPANGLDPEGIRWLRTLLRALAAEGRTVLISSHLMSELELTADKLLVIGRGRLLADTTMQEFREHHSNRTVHVRTLQSADLFRALDQAGIRHGGVKRTAAEEGAEGGPPVIEVYDTESRRVGELAAQEGIVLHELLQWRASLEDAYLGLTGDVAEFRTTAFRDTRIPEETRR